MAPGKTDCKSLISEFRRVHVPLKISDSLVEVSIYSFDFIVQIFKFNRNHLFLSRLGRSRGLNIDPLSNDAFVRSGRQVAIHFLDDHLFLAHPTRLARITSMFILKVVLVESLRGFLDYRVSNVLHGTERLSFVHFLTHFPDLRILTLLDSPRWC